MYSLSRDSENRLESGGGVQGETRDQNYKVAQDYSHVEWSKKVFWPREDDDNVRIPQPDSLQGSGPALSVAGHRSGD